MKGDYVSNSRVINNHGKQRDPANSIKLSKIVVCGVWLLKKKDLQKKEASTVMNSTERA
jgi:hypothetical protein